MELKILIVELGPENFAVDLQLTDEHGPLATDRAGGDAPSAARLQSGYKTAQQAAYAMIETLTFAPPDLTPYDEAINQIQPLMDEVANTQQSVTELVKRVGDCEDAIVQAVAPVQQPRQNPLLARMGLSHGLTQATGNTPPGTAYGLRPHVGEGVREQPPPQIRQHRPHVPTGGVTRGRGSEGG